MSTTKPRWNAADVLGLLLKRESIRESSVQVYNITAPLAKPLNTHHRSRGVHEVRRLPVIGWSTRSFCVSSRHLVGSFGMLMDYYVCHLSIIRCLLWTRHLVFRSTVQKFNLLNNWVVITTLISIIWPAAHASRLDVDWLVPQFSTSFIV